MTKRGSTLSVVPTSDPSMQYKCRIKAGLQVLPYNTCELISSCSQSILNDTAVDTFCHPYYWFEFELVCTFKHLMSVCSKLHLQFTDKFSLIWTTMVSILKNKKRSFPCAGEKVRKVCSPHFVWVCSIFHSDLAWLHTAPVSYITQLKPTHSAD